MPRVALCGLLLVAACGTAPRPERVSAPTPPPAPGVSAPAPAPIGPAPAALAPPTASPAPVPLADPVPAAAAPPSTPTPAGPTTKGPSPAPPPAAKPPVAKPAPTKPAPPAAAPPAAAPLDLKSLEQRLRATSAIGVLTKLSLKNQVDDLVARFRSFHQGQRPPTLSELRPAYELLLMKVLSLLQDTDAALARDINASREAIWAVLAGGQIPL